MRTLLISGIILSALFSTRLVDGGPSIPLMADSSDINPNGSSELSILMRDMYDHALAARKLALNGEKDTEFPKEFNKIHTATPTDETTKNSYYDTFADVYLNALKSYSLSGSEDLKLNYNNLVNTCLACHSSHCPGPVPKIRKLLIP